MFLLFFSTSDELMFILGKMYLFYVPLENNIIIDESLYKKKKLSEIINIMKRVFYSKFFF